MVDLTETDQIERDLENTRSRMDRRLDELQERLTPGQIANDALAYFQGGSGADFTQDVIAKLKANPLPAVLTGVGLAWLMASSSRPTPDQPRERLQDNVGVRLRQAEASIVLMPGEQPEAHATRLDEARGKVLGIRREASDTAASYSQRIKDFTASASQSLRRTSHDLTASLSGAANTVGKKAQHGGIAAQEGMTDMAKSTREAFASASSNPIVLGALAAVAGLVVGALIPTSNEEERLLGSTASKVRSAGRDLAQDVVDRGGNVASDALGAIKESADAHGLTADKPVGQLLSDVKSGELVGAVKQVATETADVSKQSVQMHFADSDKSSSQA